MRLPTAVVVALALTAALPTAPQAQEAPPPAVVVATAAYAELGESTGFTGRVSAAQRVDIRARIAGFVEEILFEEGALVEAGAVLYRIQDDAYRAAVAEIEGSIAAAEADRRLAELERDRRAELVRREAVAQRELDAAEAQVGRVGGELARLQGTLARAQLDLSYAEITAPFAGRTGLTTADVGALVGPETGPLTTLIRLDTVEVEFSVATAVVLDYQERVLQGTASRVSAVRLTLPNGRPYPLPGDIDFVSADVARGTDTVTVRARFDNPDGTLLDGALVGVALEQAGPEPVLTVPQQAVQRDMAGAFVMLVTAEGVVERRQVEVARNAEGLAVIATGLEEGETVITEGVNKVRPGVTVDAAPAEAG